MIKVGFISYLNAFPFYYPFVHGIHSCSVCMPVVERPGVLNKMLHDGDLDVSLISAMEYAFNPELYYILPGVALSSRGYVDSVRLVSKRKVRYLDDCAISVTSASATSVAVLRVLLHEYNIKPSKLIRYPAEDGLPEDAEAILSIGDEALTESFKDYKYSYDLGEHWQKTFGKNIVFAIAAVRRDSFEKNKDELLEFASKLATAPQASYNSPDFEKICRKTYPEINEPIKYLNRLNFEMDDVTREEIRFLFDQSYKAGVIEKPVEPEYLNLNETYV